MVPLIKSTYCHAIETTQGLCAFLQGATKLSMGEECLRFERLFAEWQGRNYCSFFNSGSSANLALIQALKNLGYLKNGDRVGFSGLTWATNVMPLFQLSLEPVPVDIEISTLNLSLESLKRTHEQKPLRALFLTNLLGFGSNLDEISFFCESQGILLIEDNCESLGSEYKNIKLGNFGMASTFSFFVGHHLSTIEGGAVCTSNTELDTMLRMVRSHGWDRHLDHQKQQQLRSQHHVDDFYGQYTFYDLGYNLRPTEIQGFLGCEQMKYINEIISQRATNFEELSVVYQNKDFLPIGTGGMTVCSNFALPIVCTDRKIRDIYIKRCQDVGIEIRPIVAGMMTDQPFYKKYAQTSYNLPATQKAHDCGFYAPNNPDLNAHDISLIIEALWPKNVKY